MGKIERVARAICREAGYNPDAGFFAGEAFHKVWERYKPQAKAAIRALKEHTNAD